jgi:hypothetical protein
MEGREYNRKRRLIYPIMSVKLEIEEAAGQA